jgi:hypothetical protein
MSCEKPEDFSSVQRLQQCIRSTSSSCSYSASQQASSSSLEALCVYAVSTTLSSVQTVQPYLSHYVHVLQCIQSCLYYQLLSTAKHWRVQSTLYARRTPGACIVPVPLRLFCSCLGSAHELAR